MFYIQVKFTWIEQHTSFLVISSSSDIAITVSDFTLGPLTPNGHSTICLALGWARSRGQRSFLRTTFRFIHWGLFSIFCH